MLGDTAKNATKKREAKQRAQILRQLEIIEKLQAMLPSKPVHRLIRKVARTIRAELGEPDGQ